jgi:plastocyanin
MRDTFRRLPLLALIPVLVAIGLGMAACGEDDEGDGGGASGGGPYGGGAAQTETETTTEEAGGAAAPRAAKVEIVDFTFSPATTTVQVGGKVNWANEDTAPHTATADDGSFDTGTIDPDKRGNATFKEAGTFSYICSIHPEMKGTVEVVE